MVENSEIRGPIKYCNWLGIDPQHIFNEFCDIYGPKYTSKLTYLGRFKVLYYLSNKVPILEYPRHLLSANTANVKAVVNRKCNFFG